jgi:uncharacterized protein YgbK (DUF1537 family)
MTVRYYDLGIVADDLTGACDVAACFAPQLGSVAVAVDLDSGLAVGLTPHVINTQSRLRDGESARGLLRRVGMELDSKRVIFKKIDAGLRGPVGAEIAGLLEGLSSSGAHWKYIVAPAIPSIGRTTRGGVQYDHGVPINQGALSQDPHSPPISADIRQVIRKTGGRTFEVADAESAEDLASIVDAYLKEECVVFVGSLGLAHALAGRLHGNWREVAPGPPARRPLLACGSRHPQASRQVEHARTAGIRTLSFDPVPRQFDGQIEDGGEGPILARILPGEAPESAEISGTLLTSFIDALGSLVEKLHTDGLAVIGGETAFQLLRRLGAQRLEVFRSQAEVIACSRISGGVMDGCRFVSKGGSVGADDAARQMLSLLSTEEAKK